MARSNEGTSANRPAREGRNVTMDSPRQTTSVLPTVRVHSSSIDGLFAGMLDSRKRNAQCELQGLQSIGVAVPPLAALADERIDHRFKGLPPDACGTTV